MRRTFFKILFSLAIIFMTFTSTHSTNGAIIIGIATGFGTAEANAQSAAAIEAAKVKIGEIYRIGLEILGLFVDIEDAVRELPSNAEIDSYLLSRQKNGPIDRLSKALEHAGALGAKDSLITACDDSGKLIEQTLTYLSQKIPNNAKLNKAQATLKDLLLRMGAIDDASVVVSNQQTAAATAATVTATVGGLVSAVVASAGAAVIAIGFGPFGVVVAGPAIVGIGLLVFDIDAESGEASALHSLDSDDRRELQQFISSFATRPGINEFSDHVLEEFLPRLETTFEQRDALRKALGAKQVSAADEESYLHSLNL